MFQKHIKFILKLFFIEKLKTVLSSSESQHRYVILHEISNADEERLKTFLSLQQKYDFTITFDDGFQSSYRAIKMLKNKSIFFVCPGFLNITGTRSINEFLINKFLVTKSYQNDENATHKMKPVTWEELRELAKLGHTIGSHTINHVRLSQIVSERELEMW